MILEQDAALLLQRGVDEAAEHAEHPGEQHAEVHLGLHDIDRGVHRLAHRRDVEVELVAGPARLDLRAAGDVLLELVDVVGDPTPRLVLAETVGQVDVDGLGHKCDVARRSALFKPKSWEYDSDDEADPYAIAADCERGSRADPASCCPRATAAWSQRAVGPGGAVHHGRARTSPGIAAGIWPRRGGQRR